MSYFSKDLADDRSPRVIFASKAKERLDLYINVASGEISGLGSVRQEGNDFLVTEIYLFEQECTSSTTNLKSEDVSRFLVEAVRGGIDPSSLKLWWHSHANMSVFWSGIDNSTIEQFANRFMISVVGNKAGDRLGRLDFYEPSRLTFHNVSIAVRDSYDPVVRLKIEEEVKRKVKSPAIFGGFKDWFGDNKKKDSAVPPESTSAAAVGDIFAVSPIVQSVPRRTDWRKPPIAPADVPKKDEERGNG